MVGIDFQYLLGSKDRLDFWKVVGNKKTKSGEVGEMSALKVSNR